MPLGAGDVAGAIALGQLLYFRISAVIADVPKHRQRLTDIANRVRPAEPSDGPSRPSALEDLTREELYARAQEAEIPGRSEMSKKQLVEALRAKS